MTKDATGHDLSPVQADLMECYEKLARVLSEHAADLAPFEQRNALKALACLWQIANGLDMDTGHIYDLGA